MSVIVNSPETIRSGAYYKVSLTDYKGNIHTFDVSSASPAAASRQAQDYLWAEAHEHDRQPVISILVHLK